MSRVIYINISARPFFCSTIRFLLLHEMKQALTYIVMILLSSLRGLSKFVLMIMVVKQFMFSICKMGGIIAQKRNKNVSHFLEDH